MSSPMPSQASPSHPTSRSSSLSQKIASKVLLLIEKFESMTMTRSPGQKPPHPRPSFTAARTSLHRLSTSVLKRASLFAEQRAGSRPEKTQPPKRRFLKVSRNQAKHQVAKKSNETEHTKNHSSNGFDCDGPTSTIDSDGTLVGTDVSSASTPPVARILPSSFFDQLLLSNGRASIRNKLKSRKGRGKGKKTAARSVQDLRRNVAPKTYGFGTKRKSVSWGLSSGGRKNANGLEDLSSNGVERTFRVLKREELDSKNQESFRNLPHGRPNLREANRSLGVLLDGDEIVNSADMIRDDGWVYGDSLYDASMEGDSIYSLDTVYTPDPTQLVCSDRRYLTTDLKYMPDGTLSNFGYFVHRLESEAGTPESGAETSNANILKINTQADASVVRRARVYRKTPPPLGFFSPENRRIPSGSSMGMRLEENFDAEEFPERPEIISPVPLNAVQAAELRGLVFRYT